jgi:hypothetical protein
MNSDPNPYAGPNPYSAPQAAPPLVSPLAGIAAETRALKLAGILICAGAVLNLVSMASVGETVVQATYSRGWVSILFDFYIGGSLAVGRFKVRGWAMIRAGLGGVLGVVALASGNVLSGALTVVSCGAILLLVAPKASSIRTTVGAGIYGAVLLVGVAAIVLSSGHAAGH